MHDDDDDDDDDDEDVLPAGVNQLSTCHQDSCRRLAASSPCCPACWPTQPYMHFQPQSTSEPLNEFTNLNHMGSLNPLNELITDITRID